MDMIAGGSFSDPRYWSGYLVSSRGVIALAPGSSRTASSPPLPAAPKAEEQSLITPRCFEFISHNDQQGPQLRYHRDIQIRIGGVVHRLQSSPTQAIYDLGADGNDVEVKTHTERVLNSDQDILGSERKWILQALVEKQPDSSVISFRFGPDHQHPENNRTITLKGKADLFPSLDLPDVLPPLASCASMSSLYAENGCGSNWQLLIRALIHLVCSVGRRALAWVTITALPAATTIFPDRISTSRSIPPITNARVSIRALRPARSIF
jgi:hypothetical protein